MQITISKTALIFSYVFVLASQFLFSQVTGYEDVAVIVNDNSPVSLSIGNYFASERGIPESRIIHINTSTEEIVDTFAFRDLQAQVEAGLLASGALDTLNYLVTTKGMPLRVSVDSTCEIDTFFMGIDVGKCTSLESELALILGAQADEILKPGRANSHYTNSNIHFSRDTFRMFLVSRLDGFNENDVKDMIDRSGPGQGYHKADAKVVLDYAGWTAGADGVFAGLNGQVEDTLVSWGMNVINDTANATYLSGLSDVIGWSGNYGSSIPLATNFDWAPGGVVHFVASNAATTFDEGLSPASADNFGDLIRDGAVGGIGYVYLTFLGPATFTWDFIPRYLDTTVVPSYNLAEAAYMSIWGLSYHAVVIGDPKTTTSPTMAGIPENPGLGIKIYPNPAGAYTSIVWQAESVQPARLRITDITGREVLTQSFTAVKGLNKIPLRVETLSHGMYLVQIKKDTGVFTGKLLKHGD